MLRSLDVDWTSDPPSDEVAAFLADAESRIDDFIAARLDDPIAGFVPSDFGRVWQGLATIARRGLAPGSTFLEWGSGFGVVACMAAMLEFDACGIEIHAPLVEGAEQLARDHGLAVEFSCGSYLPPGGEALADTGEEFIWIESGGADGYDELGLDIEDFDLVFAYPWPGEEQVVHDLFDAFGASHALLLTYNGVEDLRLYRHA